MSLPPHDGPWELLVDAAGRTRSEQKQVDDVKASGMSGSLQWWLFGSEYFISS